jgi:hypothetical protein
LSIRPWIVGSCLLPLALGPPRAASAGVGPIAVEARVPAGRPFVGQAVPLDLEVSGADGPATVIPPALRDGELIPLGGDEGGRAARHRYRLVPRKAGPLLVPSFRVEAGDRVGRSAPIRLDVRPVPTAGQGPAFLGGVGRVTPEASAGPTRVRAGEWVEYRVTLRGEGALGSTRAPGLGGLDRLGLGLRVEPLPAERSAEPPAVTFRWRLRPTRAGRASLPPVLVSTFDPDTGRFQTRATAAIPIEVAEPAGLDPGVVAYEPPPAPPRRRPGGWIWGATAACLAVAAASLAAVLRGRRARAPRLDRLAERLASRLEADRRSDPSGRALGVLDALAEFLEAAAGRPRGALTPVEAAESIRARFGDEAAADADEAGGLVARCDRASFAGAGATADEADALASGAAALLRRLARRPPKMPGEAR